MSSESKNQSDDDIYRSICNTKTLQSEYRGFFFEFADHVLKSVGGEQWLQQTFKKLKNDSNRFKCIVQNQQIKEHVFDILQHVRLLYRQKNASISQERRLAAERAFKTEHNLQKALMLYGQAVLRAPVADVELRVDGGLSLAFALWQRSELLIELKEYNKALNDLQTALKSNLPAKHKAEMYWRLAKCYMGLGQLKQAQVSIDLADQLEVDSSRKQYYKDDYLQKITQLHQQIQQHHQFVEPKITSTAHKKYKNASKLIKIGETRQLGRHAIANEQIVPGDVLVVEEPHTACLIPEYFSSNCLNCFKCVVAPVGCTECSGIAFCCVQCRDIALSTYHKYECKIMDFLLGSGMSSLCYLALRMITKLDLSEALAMYESREKLDVYKLCTLNRQRDVKDIFYRALMSVFLVRCLQLVNYFPNKSPDDVNFTENEIKVGELLLHYLQLLQFNAHEIMQLKSLKNRIKEQPVAIALYPTASLFNHSCYPSMIRYFYNNKIVLIATKNIKPGEMIGENYGPIFTQMERDKRIQNLRSRYWFQCECDACKLAWPQLIDIDESFAQLKCSIENCNGVFILPDISGKCRKCNQEPDLTVALNQLTQSENCYRQAIDYMNENDYFNAIQSIINGLKQFHSIGVPPHKETHKAEDNLKQCYLHLIQTSNNQANTFH